MWDFPGGIIEGASLIHQIHRSTARRGPEPRESTARDLVTEREARTIGQLAVPPDAKWLILKDCGLAVGEDALALNWRYRGGLKIGSLRGPGRGLDGGKRWAWFNLPALTVCHPCGRIGGTNTSQRLAFPILASLVLSRLSFALPGRT
jgi:hypothetical protein